MFRKLLVPLDRSGLAEQALGPAAAIARALHAEIDVALVHQPLAFDGITDAMWNTAQWNDEHKYLEGIADELATGASVPTTHAVLRGGIVEMICSRARDVGADLVVMTSHGRTGLSRAWLGSIADGVLRHAAIPVLVLHPTQTKFTRNTPHQLYKKILIPLDGSAFAADIVSAAVALARCSGARITLLHIVPPVPLITPDVGMPFAYVPVLQDDPATERLVDEATQQLADVARQLSEQGSGVVDSEVVVSGYIAHAIIDAARAHGVDAIAMSTHGRGASRLLLGSVTDKVLRASGLPMLLKRPVGVIEEFGAVDVSDIGRQLPAMWSVTV